MTRVSAKPPLCWISHDKKQEKKKKKTNVYDLYSIHVEVGYVCANTMEDSAWYK